jgi:hypothetical protein
MAYYNKVVDSIVSLNPITISKTENKIEYSLLVGNRVIKDPKKEGFTMDIFLGLGIGYRDITNSWDKNSDYDNKYFGFVKNARITVPIRFGVNLGYIFKNQGK